MKNQPPQETKKKEKKKESFSVILFKIPEQQFIDFSQPRKNSFLLVLNHSAVSPYDPSLVSSAQSDLQFSSPVYTVYRRESLYCFL